MTKEHRTDLTQEALELLTKETRRLWAPDRKTLASRLIELALKDKQIYERLKAEFMK